MRRTHLLGLGRHHRLFPAVEEEPELDENFLLSLRFLSFPAFLPHLPGKHAARAVARGVVTPAIAPTCFRYFPFPVHGTVVPVLSSLLIPCSHASENW